MGKRAKFKEVLAFWGMVPLKFEKVRDVYKVKTSRGPLCLKPCSKKEEKIHFIASVLNHLQHKGFNKMAAYLPTLDNQITVSFEGANYLVTDWLEGQEPNYRDGASMAKAAGTLAEFHQAAHGFTDNLRDGAKGKNKLGRWEKKLAQYTGELKGWVNTAASSRAGQFEKALAGQGEWLVTQSEYALQTLKNSPYAQLVAEAGQTGGAICHGDTATRNFIIDQNGIAKMIDFDSMAVDLRVADLWRLLRRTLRRNKWSIEVAREVLGGYYAVNQLKREEYQVLLALLTFPERAWRMTKEYYERQDEKDWSEKQLTKKLKEFLLDQANINKFIIDFKETYRC